jgi:hypothetical protein
MDPWVLILEIMLGVGGVGTFCALVIAVKSYREGKKEGRENVLRRLDDSDLSLEDAKKIASGVYHVDSYTKDVGFWRRARDEAEPYSRQALLAESMLDYYQQQRNEK